MADSKRTVDYIPELGISYVDNGDGTAQNIKGDVRNLPGFRDNETRTGPRLKPTPQGESKMKTAGKDLMVNIASQLPLAIPGLGIGARSVLSGLAGMGADQMASPEKPIEESAMEAILNTLIGGTTEGLAGGTLHAKMPNPRMGIAGSGRFGKAWLSLSGLSPLARNPMVTAPGSDMLDLLKMVPSVESQVKGQMSTNGGKFLAQTAIEAIKNAKSAKEKQIILDSLKKLGMFNILPGVGANEAFDLTLNSKNQ